MDNQRFFLWVALAAILIMLWTSWQEQYGPPDVVAPIAETPTVPADLATPSVPSAPSQKTQQAVTDTPTVKSIKLVSGKKIRVLTDLLEVEIDTYGGDIRTARLRTYPIALDKLDVPFELLNEKSDTLFFAQSGLLGRDRKYPDHKTRYQARKVRYELKPGEKELKVVLSWRAPDGVTYDKVYRFTRDSYVIDISYRINNRSRSEWQGYLYGQLQRIPPEEETGLFRLPTYSGGAIYTQEENYEKISYGDMTDGPLKDKTTLGGWAAIMQHYFVVSWMASPKQLGQLYTIDLGNNR